MECGLWKFVLNLLCYQLNSFASLNGSGKQIFKEFHCWNLRLPRPYKSWCTWCHHDGPQQPFTQALNTDTAWLSVKAWSKRMDLYQIHVLWFSLNRSSTIWSCLGLSQALALLCTWSCARRVQNLLITQWQTKHHSFFGDKLLCLLPPAQNSHSCQLVRDLISKAWVRDKKSKVDLTSQKWLIQHHSNHWPFETGAHYQNSTRVPKGYKWMGFWTKSWCNLLKL